VEPDRLKYFFDVSLSLLCTADATTNTFVDLNPAWQRTLGWTLEELRSRPFTDFIHPDDLTPTLAIISDMVNRGQDAVNFENRYRHKNGNWVWLSWYGAVRGGRFYSAAQPINAHKQALEALAEVNAELEAFSYTVSHDLRAPLRHINGFVDMLKRSAGPKLDEESRRHLDTIAGAAGRMGRLIDDLVAFSRMSRVELQRQRVDLSLLVQGVIAEQLEHQLGHPVEIVAAPLPDVSGDASMLRVVFANLVSNALKYSRTRAQARVEIGSQPGEDGKLVVYVRDNGVGFDMRYADKLFGVFQRLHGADEFEGTGIGLATVQRIMHRHAGRCWAESALDAGATFYISWPARPEGES